MQPPLWGIKDTGSAATTTGPMALTSPGAPIIGTGRIITADGSGQSGAAVRLPGGIPLVTEHGQRPAAVG
jgi:hypothetical protein